MNCSSLNLNISKKRESRAVRKCDKNIEATLLLVNDMLALADQGDEDREDSGCGIMYGVIRDSAYKIKQLAERERSAHIRKGWWHERSFDRRSG